MDDEGSAEILQYREGTGSTRVLGFCVRIDTNQTSHEEIEETKSSLKLNGDN